MTDFAQAFQNDHNNISNAVNEIGLLVSQDLPSHSTKSHYFFDAHGGIYSANAFPSPTIHINPFFRTIQKPPQVSVKTFYLIYLIILNKLNYLIFI